MSETHSSSQQNWLAVLADRMHPRPGWLTRNPEDGLPLAEAALFYGNERDAKTVTESHARNLASDFRLVPWGTDPYELRFDTVLRRAEDRLRSALKDKLLSGELFATGFSDHQPLDKPATRILPDRWRILNLDILASSGSAPGLSVSGILVFDPVLSTNRRRKKPASRFSESAVRDWYLSRIEEKQQAGIQPSRDDDYADAQQAFGKPIPGPLLRRLRAEFAPEEWKRGGRPKRKR